MPASANSKHLAMGGQSMKSAMQSTGVPEGQL